MEIFYFFQFKLPSAFRLIISVGEQSSLGEDDVSARMFKPEYFQMY